MGPSFAESAVQRGRFLVLLALAIAGIAAMVVLAVPRTHHHHRGFHGHHFKRVGHCVDGARIAVGVGQ